MCDAWSTYCIISSATLFVCLMSRRRLLLLFSFTVTLWQKIFQKISFKDSSLSAVLKFVFATVQVSQQAGIDPFWVVQTNSLVFYGIGIVCQCLLRISKYQKLRTTDLGCPQYRKSIVFFPFIAFFCWIWGSWMVLQII